MIALLAIFIILFISNRSRYINIYFLGFILISLVFSLIDRTFFARTIDSEYDYISLSIFIFAVIPLVLLTLSIIAFFSSKILLEKEGRRLRNLMISAIGFASLIILLLSVYHYVQDNKTTLSEFIYLYIVAFFVYFLWLFSSTAIYALIYNAAPITYTPKYILILGSGLIGDRVPPLLASRLDKAIQQYKKYNEEPLLITSGGQGQDELLAEGLAMKKYIVDKYGIATEKIIAEDQSTTTYENMLFSKRIIDLHSKNAKGIFVTNNFHVLRASLYARKVGLIATGRGSNTALYYVPNAFMREFVGLLEMTKWLHISLITLFTIGWFIIITGYL